MKRLTIFAHYDGQREVKPYIVYLLEHLRPLSDRIVFTSASELPEAEQARALRHADEVIIKSTPGYDFGMWKQVLEGEDLDAYDEVVLTNSSVFGPVFPLDEILDGMSRHPCDFWGATENWELSHHLQSYFLVFKRPVLESEAFARFWASVLPYSDKGQVIRSYEVGLSIYLWEAGFQGVPLVRSKDLFPGEPLKRLFSVRRGNHTCLYPERLLDAGMPFVKAEALRDNPAHAPVGRVRKAMARAGYPMELVEFDRPAGNHKVYHVYLRHIQRPITDVLTVLAPPLMRVSAVTEAARNGAPPTSSSTDTANRA